MLAGDVWSAGSQRVKCREHKGIDDNDYSVESNLRADGDRPSRRDRISSTFGGKDICTKSRKQIALKQLEQALGLFFLPDFFRIHPPQLLLFALQHTLNLRKNSIGLAHFVE
jgi:hypothetical protein